MIRALVVDDTSLYRTLVSEILQQIPDIRVVGTASNGRLALAKIYTLKPDFVTLDIEMPEMNGIEVLQTLAQKNLKTSIVVVSSLTARGGELTMKALELGAFDFVTKPESAAGRAEFERIITVIAKTLGKKLEIAALLKDFSKSKAASPSPTKPAAAGQAAVTVSPPAGRPTSATAKRDNDIVAIGISTGGPHALMRMLPTLPANLGVPVVIVQHMPPLFTANLAASLGPKCALPVKEAENGETLTPGIIYIAPGGKQTKIALAADAVTKIIRVSDDPPENGCLPSADYLFRSVAHLYYGKATAVIMTGMGSDGLKGIDNLKRAGAYVVAQDEESCVVYGMPKAVVDAGLADAVLTLEDIGPAITKSVG